jgi:curli biogenesis system outer membrane secretion channel CsgG
VRNEALRFIKCMQFFCHVSILPARSLPLLLGLVLLASCATTAPAPQVSTPAALDTNAVAAPPPAHVLKRKIAVGRFDNETLYGKALLISGETDPLAKQTSDMMTNALNNTGAFVVLERSDLGLVEDEQALSGAKGNIVGADDLLVGSLTQFGRETEGENGFLSNTKKQVAYATVDIRLVDVKTAQVIFTATGTGQASVENGTVAGFGNDADYDETLNDRAISAAIDDAMTPLVQDLTAQPWHTDILKVDGDTVYISGGIAQNLTPGTTLAVMQAGNTVKSAQSGFNITLPPQQIATLTVVSNFGADQESQGSICSVTSGTLPSPLPASIYVAAGATP